MVIIENEIIGDIPVLQVVRAEWKDKKRPFIIFVHGFESAKEHNLHYAYLLAEKGFRVILPEVKYHGERQENITSTEYMFQFWSIVVQTIDELESVKNYYISKGEVDEAKIGLVGTSMGGIVTLGALTQFDWIKAAVSLMGSPKYIDFAKMQIAHFKQLGVNIPFSEEELNEQYEKLRPYDLSLQTNKLDNRPLLFWHGIKDQVVPFQPTYDFYEEIKKQYKNQPEKVKFISDDRAGHKVSREGLLNTVEWFEKWLN